MSATEQSTDVVKPSSAILNDAKATALEQLGKAAQLFGALSIGVYAIGFLVINAYLGDLGVRHLDLLSAQYFSAGALFLFLAIDFWFCAGRHARTVSEDLKEYVTSGPLSHTKRPVMPWILGRVFFATQFLYVLSLTIVLYSLFFFGPIPPERSTFFTAILLTGFVRFDTFRTLKDVPALAARRLVLLSILQAVTFLVFVWIASTVELALFGFLLIGVLIIWFVSDQTLPGEMRKTLWIGSIVGLGICGALYFGSYIYPEVSPRLAGGKALPVQLVLDSKASADLKAVLLTGVADSRVKGLQLVTETHDDYILLRPGQKRTVIRVPKKSVEALIYERP